MFSACILEKQQQLEFLIDFLNGTSVHKQGTDVPLKFSNFMKNEKETFKMQSVGLCNDHD
jgi:hypothetical protein